MEYETTFRKEEVKQLDLNYDQFRKLIERNPVDTNNIELGYHFGFFSSLKESESAGITFMIGNRIGNGKINRVLNNYQHTSFAEGIYKLKETPIDIRNESDIAVQRNIMKKLKLG